MRYKEFEIRILKYIKVYVCQNLSTQIAVWQNYLKNNLMEFFAPWKIALGLAFRPMDASWLTEDYSFKSFAS